MAKHNQITLNGQVIQDPHPFTDKNGVLVRMAIALKVIRGRRDIGNNILDIKYDFPAIVSGNKEILKIMKKIKKGDMIEVKGSITTRNTIKHHSCPHCGEKNQQNGVIVFITPIYIGIRERQKSEADGLELLKERCEISNQATLIGPLCRDVKRFKLDTGLNITTYQMAVRRKFRVIDDSAENRVDFPWIKSYGDIAVKDGETLKKGSYIFVDGMVRTRRLKRRCVCEHCQEAYAWEDLNMEIIPYAVEYLREYKTVEDIEKEKEEQSKADRKEVEAILRKLSEDEIDNEKPTTVPEKYEFDDEEDEENNNKESAEDLKKSILG